MSTADRHKRGRRPTLQTVAERAGVSKSLVSLVLNGSPRVSQESRTAVERAISELDYRPNITARSLREGRTHTIGVLVHDVRQPWYWDVLDGLAVVLHSRGQQILLADAQLDRLMDESLTRTFRDMNVDGLVLAGTMSISPTLVEVASQMPTVTAGWRDLDLPEVDIVANDDVAGAALATRHLIELGHTRIAHISGKIEVAATARMRREGYEETMRNHGLADNIMIERSNFTEDTGYRAAVRLLNRERPPTAIFVGNDMACIGAQCAAVEMNINVPGQLSLVGYDNTYLAGLRTLWLTSVDGAGFEVGRLAARTLLARIDDPLRPAERLTLAPTLEVRGSTAPPTVWLASAPGGPASSTV